MTMRKAWSLLLAAALVLATAPVSAQSFAPNTIWGQVPSGLSGNVANAVLVDANGNMVATAQLVNGRFEFPNVTPGDYTVELKDAGGKTLASSVKATLVAEGVLKVLFTGDSVVGAVPPGGGGPSTALLVVGGAMLVGVGTTIVINEHNKNKAPESPKK
jgi:hypothetical protein